MITNRSNSSFISSGSISPIVLYNFDMQWEDGCARNIAKDFFDCTNNQKLQLLHAFAQGGLLNHILHDLPMEKINLL